MRGYAICTAARSGSNYLDELLTATGQLGRPAEYFNAHARRIAGIAGYPNDPEAQLASILELGATPNGVYGLKIFAEQFDTVARVKWPLRLPNLAFVHLERRDVLGQAISKARAEQTQQYRSNQTAEHEPVYDGVRINNCLVQLVRDQARWRFYFAKNDIAVLRLVYEDIAADPVGAVRAVAEHIGFSGQLTLDMSQVHVRVQRDDLSQDWRRRFVAESAAPEVFD